MKQRRGIRQIIIWAGIFLLLGAIVNIGVAWGFALWHRRAKSSQNVSWENAGEIVNSEVTECSWWTVDIGSLPGLSIARSFWLPGAFMYRGASVGNPRAILPAWALHLQEPPPSTEGRTQREIIASGWPCIAFSCEWWNSIVHLTPSVEGGIHLARSNSQATQRWPLLLLPCRPIWPGFAINTLFYAAILWLLFTARLALPYARRRRRIKRGLCPACAYPVGTSDLCTECGKPVPSPRGR